MCEPLFVVPLVLAAWCAAAAILAGLGLPLHRTLRLSNASALGAFLESFWLGLALCLAALQLWHLGWPVDGRATVLLTGLGLAGLGSALRRGVLKGLMPSLTSRAGLWGYAFVACSGLAVAAAALRPATYYDSGLYHFTSLEWIKSFAVVPGLGNLHGRLAYNSTFLLFAALFEVGPGVDRSQHLANGLMLWMLLLHTLRLAWPAVRPGASADPRALFSAFLVGPIVARIFGGSLSSLSTDLSAFVLSFVLAQGLVKQLTQATHPRRGNLASLTWIAAALGTIKLNLAILAGSVLLLALGAWWNARRPSLGQAVRTGLAMGLWGGILALPWMARSIVLSGYGVFPGGLIPVDVDWRIPRSMVVDEANWIYSRAREMTPHWGEVLGSWDWLGGWVKALPLSVIAPGVLATIAAIYLAVRLTIPQTSEQLLGKPLTPSAKLSEKPLTPFLIIPPALALVAWFVTAPNPRFAFALFALLAATLLGLVAQSSPRPRRIIGAVFLVLSSPALLDPFSEDANDRHHCSLPTPPHTVLTTDDGLDVHVPISTIQTWKLPLPSTPYFKPGLRQRIPGDLAAGFRLPSRPVLANHEEGVVPAGFSVDPALGVNLVSGWAQPDAVDRQDRVLSDAGRLMIWTDSPTLATLRITASRLAVVDLEVPELNLRATTHGEERLAADLRPHHPLELSLELKAGFNELTLELQHAGHGPRRGDVLGIYRLSAEVEIDLRRAGSFAQPER